MAENAQGLQGVTVELECIRVEGMSTFQWPNVRVEKKPRIWRIIKYIYLAAEESFPWNSAVGNWLFSSYAASARKTKTLKLLSGLIEDNSFKKLVAYEDDLRRAPGRRIMCFQSIKRCFDTQWLTRVPMIATITAKHLNIYISIYIFVQHILIRLFLLLLTSISISRGGKSLSYRLVGFSEISPPQSLFQLFTDFNLMLFIYL